MGKNSKDLPTLTRESHEDWFRQVKLEIKSKGVFYTIETTRKDFAWIPSEGRRKEQAPPPETLSSTSTDTSIDQLASEFEQLGGTWDLEKSRQWDRDEAKALKIILEGLSSDDSTILDEYETAASVWTQLKLKYERTSTSTANQYMTSLHAFSFDKELGIDGSWSRLKEFRRKIVAANAAMKNSYPDDALFLILTLALQKQGQYTAVIDGFLTQQSLTIDEKIKILQEKEARLDDSKVNERAHAAWRQHREVYRHPNHRSRRHSHSSDSDTSMNNLPTTCYCCGSADHWVAECKYQAASREYARKLREKDEGLAKPTRGSGSRAKTDKLARPPRETGSRVKVKKSGRPTNSSRPRKGHAAVHDSNSDSDSDESEKEELTESEEDSEPEKVMLSKESISKTTPDTWAIDTGASSSMTDQIHLFRELKPIPKVHIQVGGGMLYSRMRGIAKVMAVDGTSCFLDNVLFVPKLGVNLISAKKLCKGGYQGAFDEENIWITKGNRKVLTAVQSRGLYVVKHVSKTFQGEIVGSTAAAAKTPAYDVKAMPAGDVADEGTESENDDEPTTEKELKRYIKYHERFAHLGPSKLRDLHKVTTLKKKITIPKEVDICDVCSLTKMKNRVRKQLSVWPTEPLELIQFDVAGPLPPTIRGNRYFLLIVDICTRRDWVIPMKLKSDAFQVLKEWKVSVEFQSGKKIKRARSDNAPELLKVTNEWKVEEGIIAQSTTIASSHQNGPAERNIQTVEFDVRAMLEEAELPLELWDEAAEADSYMRNRTATGPVIDNKKTCPIRAFTGEIPSIDHIRKWGSKCFYYVDRKTIPNGQRHDKLVNPGRVGVFMGYSDNTTKHFRVYSPERGSTIVVSRIIIKETSKGGSVDLRFRDCPAGPQGTRNIALDRRNRGRPRNENQLPPSSRGVESSSHAETPLFIPPIGVPMNTEADIADGTIETGPRVETDEERTSKTVPRVETAPTATNDTPPEKTHETVHHVDHSQLVSDNRTATATKNYLQESAPPSTGTAKPEDQPEALGKGQGEQIDIDEEKPERHQYFTRSKKRTASTSDDREDVKRIRAMIAKILSSKKPLKEDLIDAFDEMAYSAEEIAGIKIPQTHKQAMASAKAKEWRAAMSEEMLSLYANGTFREVIPPTGSNLVSCKWVYTIKTTSSGEIERYKARLVARGFSQIHGKDYHQTFAPTVRMDTLRLFLATVAAEDLECSQYDIKNAFTESELKETIYLKVPEGIPVKKGYAWQAMKSLYGLKQAARDWNILIKNSLKSWGFKQSLADPCMFVHETKSVKLLVYVDDIVASAKSQGELDWFYRKLSARFNAKNLGEIEKILGARVTRDRKHRVLEIDQEQYLTSVLDKFGITQESHKPRKTPATGYENLRPADSSDERIDITEYQQCVGSLMYAMIFTRPDIAFILGKLSQYMSDPAKHHGHVLKNLLRYLKSTVKLRLRFGPNGKYNIAVLYSDADWASDKVDRKSVSGSVAMFFGGPIAWSSKKQRSVATSSCESEYVALANCAKQGQWFAQVFRDLGYPQYIGKDPQLVQVFGDNQGAIALSENAHLNERSKHIDISYHFIRDLTERGYMRTDYIPTVDMVADGMTKPLERVAFERFKSQMGLKEELGTCGDKELMRPSHQSRQ